MASVAVGISCMGPLGVKQGHIGPILAVPLNLHLTPLGHCGLNLDALMYFVIKQLLYDVIYNMCCGEKINDLSFFFLSVLLLFFLIRVGLQQRYNLSITKYYQK